jgi:cyclic-di-GMP-binding protein
MDAGFINYGLKRDKIFYIFNSSKIWVGFYFSDRIGLSLQPKKNFMPSFDIVSKVDAQNVDNAINVAKKEILTRYDFRESKSSIELDKKNLSLTITTENEMRIDAIEDVIRARLIKQGIDPLSLDFGKEQYASGSMIRKDIKIKEGIDKETAKKVVKAIKDSGLKVQAAIMDDQIRVTGKKLDDLQAVIALCKRSNFETPLQFINMKS